MTRPSAIFVIYNPNSTGSGKDLAEEFAQNLRDADIDVPIELTPTDHAGHAIELAEEFARFNERPLIVSSSGDGGYNELVNGAMKAQKEHGSTPICAVLPAGNANDHRRTLEKRPIWEAVRDDDLDHIDVLRAEITPPGGATETKYAHSYIGIGLTPTIAVELNRNQLSRIKETWIVLKALRDFHPVEIEAEGRHLVVDSLIFANIGQMAKVLTIAENAEPDDGLFQIVTFPYRRKPALLASLLKATLFGIKGRSARSYEFRTTKHMVMQFDGEVMEIDAGSVVNIGVEPKALATYR